MKVLGAAIAAGVILLSGSLLAPQASAQSIRLGPGGVRIDTDRDHDRWDRRDRCRTVIERRRNRWGEWVEERRRVCRR
jgi:hypothetical protein